MSRECLQGLVVLGTCCTKICCHRVIARLKPLQGLVVLGTTGKVTIFVAKGLRLKPLQGLVVLGTGFSPTLKSCQK